jgi:hypothetical protein
VAGIESHRDENSSASRWISPGLVQNEEIILRTVLDPHHIEAGQLSPAAISLSDLQSRGWSVDRKRYTSLWRMRIFHKRWHQRRSDLKQCYVIPINVGRLRQDCNINGTQLFSIIDMALCLNPAHGTVILSAKSGDGAARKARKLLMDFLPQYIDVSDTFSRDDRWGWSRGMLLKIVALLRTLGAILRNL